jgi:flagellar motor switch protein FliM
MAADGGAIDKPVISEEEAAALLEKDGTAQPGGVKTYDLAGSQRITRGRLPALETIHDTFARAFRVALFNILQREPQVTYEGIKTQKAGDHLAGINLPASLDLCRMKPLPGTALFVFDPNLIFVMVDTYFGGPGRSIERDGDRGLTPTEVRFVQVVLRQVAQDLSQAWRPVAQVEIELIKHESNPLFASVAAPTDTVLVNRFNVELPSGKGWLDLVMPAAMIEPLREVLTAGIVSQVAGTAGSWAPVLSKELREAQVELRGVLTEVDLDIGELVKLQPGDVVPIEAPRDVTLYSGEVPLYLGRFGVSREHNAVKIVGPVPRKG